MTSVCRPQSIGLQTGAHTAPPPLTWAPWTELHQSVAEHPPTHFSHSSSSDPLTSTHYWYQKTNITAPLPCLKHVGHQRDLLDLLSEPPPASPMVSTAPNPAEPTHCTLLCNTVPSSWNTLSPPFTRADLIFKCDLYLRDPQLELPSFPVATHPPEMIIRAPPPQRP